MHLLRLGRLALVLAPYPPSIEPGIPPVYGDGTYQGGFGVAHVGLHVDSVEDAAESVADARFCQSRKRMLDFDSPTLVRRPA